MCVCVGGGGGGGLREAVVYSENGRVCGDFVQVQCRRTKRGERRNRARHETSEQVKPCEIPARSDAPCI